MPKSVQTPKLKPAQSKPSPATAKSRAAPRNILLITADQWRGDCLGAMGHPMVKTPHIDALAADAVLFARHYTACAPCGPARASLHTGMYLQNHRSCRNGTPLDERFTNLALEARKAGYDPVLFGYTDTSRDPRHTPRAVLKAYNYEGILPGFRPLLLLPEHRGPWLQDLKNKGYDIDQDMFAPRANDPSANDPLHQDPLRDDPARQDQGRSFAPTPYSADDSPTAFLTRHVLDFLDQQNEQGQQGQQDEQQTTPHGWFAHVSYLRPHPPFIAPGPYNAMYSARDVPAPIREPSLQAHRNTHPWLQMAYLPRGDWPDSWMHETLDGPDYERDVRQLRATYYGLVSKVDHYIGQVIAHLKKTGAYDNTLIIVTSDHGEMLGDHYLFGKRSFYDQGYHIPLIIRDPQAEACRAHGTIVDAYSESIDIMPTILNWLEIEPPRQCDGASLLPLVSGQRPQNWRTAVHWEYDFRDVRDPWIEQRLNISLDQCTLNVIRDDEFKYVHFTALPPLFFDRKADPHELNNVADDPAYAPIMLRYAQKMLSWRMSNDERVLTGMTLTPNGVMERH